MLVDDNLVSGYGLIVEAEKWEKRKHRLLQLMRKKDFRSWPEPTKKKIAADYLEAKQKALQFGCLAQTRFRL